MASTLLAIIGGIVPALVWLWFWLKEDTRHPEPKPLIGETFLLGALAVIPAYFLEKLFGISDLPTVGATLWWLVLAWATVEEILKYQAVRVGAMRSHFYDEPVDPMIYLITAALGFAAVENTLFILSALGQGGSELAYLLTGNFRFLGATLVHIVSSALVGGMLGISFYRSAAAKRVYLVGGLLAAILLHAVFNYFIIKSASDEIFKIFALLWAAGVVLILFFERVKKTGKINQTKL